MYLKLFEDNPNTKDICKVVDILKSGGIIIYPTDSVYAMGCDINNIKALHKLAQLKGIKLEKSQFSIICPDISSVASYTKLSNNAFKLLKRCLPGPFTFILPISGKVPKHIAGRRKTIGVRIPDNFIVRAISQELGSPLVTTSIHDEDEIIEYTTDPELIHERYQKMVDLVIDGGYGKNIATTIVDCSQDEFEIIRQGIGIIDYTY